MAKSIEQFESVIRTLVPISDLNPGDQKLVLEAAEVIPYRKGKYVFNQGDRDKYQFFLLQGELELYSDGQLVKRIVGGTDAARNALAQLQPRQLSAKTRSASSVLRIDRTLLEKFLSVEQTDGGGGGVVEVSELESGDEADWMSILLRSELFARLPATNIHRIFATLESIEASAGDVIIEQGAPGDYYYIIQKGRCRVTRKVSGDEEVTLAELHEGDAFGEEALVSGATRNATVSMITGGQLMRLTKDDFVELIKRPTLQSVDYDEAKVLLRDGAAWVDVRQPDEHRRSGLEGSRNLPLTSLRSKTGNLERARAYIVYCDDGRRSAAGTFLLKERGFDAYHLAGGLAQSPFADRLPGRTGAAGAQPSPPAPKQAGAQPANEQSDAEVRVSALSAELAKANVKLEEALRQKSEAERASRQAEQSARERVRQERQQIQSETPQAAQARAEEIKRAAEQAAEQKLQREREKLKAESERANRAFAEAKRLKAELEQAKRAAEAQAKRDREQEEARIQRLQREAEERLKRDKAQLEAEYARTAEELARIRRMKEEAETRLREERERLQAQAEAARERLDEANRIKAEMERARVAAEAQRRQHEAAERKLREEVVQRINQERRRLEAEFARAAEEMDQARRDKADADATRRAAAREAQRIIEEHKARYDKMRAEEEARLKAERARLEREAQRIQQTLEEARRAKAEAEQARREAQARIAELRESQERASRAGKAAEEHQLTQEIQAVEAEISQARENAEVAARAQRAAEEAKRAHDQQLASQHGEIDALRQKMEREMAEWLREQRALEESETKRRLREVEHVDRVRMRRRSEEAKRAQREHDAELLKEISRQLGGDED